MRLDKISRKTFSYSLIVLTIWSFIILFFTWQNIKVQKDSTNSIIMNIATLSFNKDLAYRKWAASHGGVYVEPSSKTPPSPWMSHIEDRDIITTDGKKLTLMNPAYMLREMMQDYSKLYGIKGRIVGKIFLNSNNEADEWEAKAIESFDNGVKEVVEWVDIDGQEYLRLMKPMIMQESCQKCHGHLGFANGSVRGGVSVSVPTKIYKENEKKIINNFIIIYLFIWLFGVISIILISILLMFSFKKRKLAENRIMHLAHYDQLTKLPNRTLFQDMFKHSINIAKRRKNKVALAFIDIDGFKNVNDTKGHPVGDKLLIEIAKVIKKQIRNIDILSRLGGDEFTIIFENVKNDIYLIRILEKVLKSLEQEIIVENQSIFISASLGLSIYPNDGEDIHTLIKNADTAMYQAKENGKNGFCFYEKFMTSQALDYVALETAILSTIKNKEFLVYYQPKISAVDSSVIGTEALVRWISKDKGFISPDKFIPIAENMHIVNKIDMFVLEQVCIDIKEYINLGYTEIKVSVNLSGYDIGVEDIYDEIIRIVNFYKVNPLNIEFEITETYFASFNKHEMQTLNALKEYGFSLSIDDFGTGYSSLNNIKKLPVEILKIDQSFIKDLEENEENKKLVKMIINLAHTFSLKAIAEGVETESHLKFLKEEGCDYIQGYLEGKPMPKEEFIEYLKGKTNAN